MSTNVLRVFAFLSIASLSAARENFARAQFPNSYGAYYQQNAAIPAVQSSNRYLYDKYFYHNPAVSPYLNLGRAGSDFTTNYQAFVRPELERREAMVNAGSAYVQQRKLAGDVGRTNYNIRLPSSAGGAINYSPVPNNPAKPSSYYNHWYGGWSNR